MSASGTWMQSNHLGDVIILKFAVFSFFNASGSKEPRVCMIVAWLFSPQSQYSPVFSVLPHISHHKYSGATATLVQTSPQTVTAAPDCGISFLSCCCKTLSPVWSFQLVPVSLYLRVYSNMFIPLHIIQLLASIYVFLFTFSYKEVLIKVLWLP